MGNGVSGKWEKYTTVSVRDFHCKIVISLSLHFLCETIFTEMRKIYYCFCKLKSL
jgi:hypothetical protein